MRNVMIVAAALTCTSQSGYSQAVSSAFDRSRAPHLAPPAPLVVPAVSASSMPNGLSIRTVEQRELPLVQITAVVSGGARLDGSLPGVATFVAGMLDEGAGSRSASDLQSEIAYLGASLSTRADWDAFYVSLKVPVRSLGPAMDLLADVVRRPAFSAGEVRRQRDLRLAALLQARDQPNALAGLAFSQIVFPQGHPYHHSITGDSSSTEMLDSTTVRSFYNAAFRPDRTTFFVVGDITPSAAREAVSSRFADWRPAAAGARLSPPASEPLRQTKTSVYLVDKPEAAQSVITIGWPGVNRTSPDYAALMVMNTILGGSFTSRLNMNLREAKGYSYGARSGYNFRQLPGPFTASAAVRTDVTDSSLVEFVKELNAVRSAPVPAQELERAQALLELGLPGSLEGTSQIASQMTELATFALSLDALPRFASAVRAVTVADVQRVAREYLTPDRATVVVVGDVARIRKPVEALQLGTITVLDVKSVAK
ncbi:MAG: M16 family metallopeptidase [Gemmatimonadota bacterium]